MVPDGILFALMGQSSPCWRKIAMFFVDCAMLLGDMIFGAVRLQCTPWNRDSATQISQEQSHRPGYSPVSVCKLISSAQ